jgi:hypothetical protein
MYVSLEHSAGIGKSFLRDRARLSDPQVMNGVRQGWLQICRCMGSAKLRFAY